MRRLSIISIAIGTIIAASSCSVKEDRDECPCWLQIDLSGCVHFGPEVQLKGWNAEKNVLGSKVYEEDYSALYEAEVPRGEVSYCAVTGIEENRTSGTEILIPEGEQSDRIFAYRADVMTDGEAAYDKVHLHKQYATVTMSFAESEGMAVNDISAEIVSPWSGISLRSLQPTEGSFRYRPERNPEGLWTFRLPRQGDDSIAMNVYSENQLIDTIRLGETISNTGYDWTADDLDDIWIGVDWAQGEISVRIEGWDPGQIYTETI